MIVIKCINFERDLRLRGYYKKKISYCKLLKKLNRLRLKKNTFKTPKIYYWGKFESYQLKRIVVFF